MYLSKEQQSIILTLITILVFNSEDLLSVYIYLNVKLVDSPLLKDY